MTSHLFIIQHIRNALKVVICVIFKKICPDSCTDFVLPSVVRGSDLWLGNLTQLRSAGYTKSKNTLSASRNRALRLLSEPVSQVATMTSPLLQIGALLLLSIPGRPAGNNDVTVTTKWPSRFQRLFLLIVVQQGIVQKQVFLIKNIQKSHKWFKTYF